MKFPAIEVSTPFHNRRALGFTFEALKVNRNSDAVIFFFYAGISSAVEIC